MMPYDDLLERVQFQLERARTLDGLDIVRDLYEVEVEYAARGLRALIVHPDHVTGRVPAEVMSEINRREREAFPSLHFEGVTS